MRGQGAAVWLRWGALVLAAALDAHAVRPGGFGDPALLNYDDLATAIAVQERHNPDLLDLPGVAGTAVGLDPSGRLVVKVYLEQSEVAGIPASLDGHRLATEVTGPFRALGADAAGAWGGGGEEDDPRGLRSDASEAGAGGGGGAHNTDPKGSFPRPVPIGVSTGQPDVTAGTIGARVRSGDRVFALSNNHVFANRNQASLGDPILQPGRVDGGADPADAIGVLHDFEPIRFCDPAPSCPENRIDAAIAATTPEQLSRSTPEGGYGTPRSDPAAARIGMPVQKHGRTTGQTTGTVSGLNATLNIGFGDENTARFAGQIVITGGGFSAPGDSGSLIVAGGAGPDARRPVGLLFAGSATSTIANPIQLVLDRFGVSIDGEPPP